MQSDTARMLCGTWLYIKSVKFNDNQSEQNLVLAQ